MEPQEVHNICRFCLCQDEHLLRPITRTLSASLTLEDVGQFTGIKINAKESMSFAMCFKCAETLRSCASFRQSCMNNDAQFQELLEVLVASGDVFFDETVEPWAEQESDPLNLHFVIQDDDDDEVVVVLNDDDSGNVAKDATNEYPSIEEQETYSANYIDIGEHSPSEGNDHDTFPSWIKNRPLQARATSKQRVKSPKLCSVCGKLVINIRIHRKLHANDRHSCSQCPEKFVTKFAVANHIKAVHLKLVHKTCELCGKDVTSRGTYVSHMLCHHGIGKKFECPDCPRLFNSRHILKNHMARIHSNVMRLKCEICGKLFTAQPELTAHMSYHSTEQPYQCSKCPKRFKTSYGRKNHERSHSGIPFECTLCGNVYRNKPLLNIHLRKQHLNEAVRNEAESARPSTVNE